MNIKNTQPKIYIISGKARNGKDTVANIIKTISEENKLKHLNLQYSTYLKQYAQKISDWDGNDETKPRDLLQYLGTDLIRKEIDFLFFVNRMCEDIKVYSKFFDVITISDTRYKVEIDIPKEKFENVFSISVVRPNLESTLTNSQKQHLSEIDLDDYDKYDHVIINDSDLKELENKVRKIIEKDLKKPMISHNEMRQMWFDFWTSKEHDIILSAPLVPINDPTLLWINAGITPLKKYFDGTLVPNNRRMASSQKCIRTNDIENVGKTARHATFFEMLGNFSIGDYFKKEAVNWSWEFLTSNQWLGFDPEKLYVTIYPTDEEAHDAWIEVGVPEERIIRLEGNFWEIGPGPSGPCSEIFYDRGDYYDPNNLGVKLLRDDIDNERYIEIWNNVFSMYNAEEGVDREDYKELPSKNIDTGMGLERILTILQNVNSIYDTDLFLPIIYHVVEISGCDYKGEMSFKVIADHMRTITFALSDGASFGNSGRDYVLRRLLRRSVRHGKKLGIEEPFMYKLVPTVVKIMEQHYPYLKEHEEKVMDKIKCEEQLFHQTLIDGEKKLNELIKSSPNQIISGEDAFKLYDTYGFPFELTLETVEEKGYKLSKEEFDASMKHQQDLARSARTDVSSMNVQNEALINFKDESNFIGYETISATTKVIGLFDGEKMVDKLIGEGYVVMDETPFYAESGGQVSDQGTLKINNQTFDVLELFKGPNNQHFHYIKTEEEIKIGDEVLANVNEKIRNNTRKNHSAAHLLQKSLREVLGKEVMQAGSRVDDKTLRFDFTYDNKISDEEVIKIENLVNEKIQINTPTTTEIMSLDEAIKKGAVALFEEKYGDKVRLLTIADSIELCGGTHVANVSDIEKFAIISIESKGNNIYRIEATTGNNIEEELFKAIKPYNDSMIKLLQKSKKIIEEALSEEIELKFNVNINHDKPVSYNDVIFNQNELEEVLQKVQTLEKEYNEAKKKKALIDLSLFENNLEEINGVNTIIMTTDKYELSILKEIINVLSNKFENSLIFIANINENNVNYLAKTTDSLKDTFNCGELVKDAATKSNGSGGGSRVYAQGGGTSIDNINNIMEDIKVVVKNIKK
ncbi:MAG: alanine--tRNA ligase [Bacilli bacterium]|nr:alanine--tRNA ligase [Bacilli bacterium]